MSVDWSLQITFVANNEQWDLNLSLSLFLLRILDYLLYEIIQLPQSEEPCHIIDKYEAILLFKRWFSHSLKFVCPCCVHYLHLVSKIFPCAMSLFKDWCGGVHWSQLLGLWRELDVCRVVILYSAWVVIWKLWEHIPRYQARFAYTTIAYHCYVDFGKLLRSCFCDTSRLETLSVLCSPEREWSIPHMLFVGFELQFVEIINVNY